MRSGAAALFQRALHRVAELEEQLLGARRRKLLPATTADLVMRVDGDVVDRADDGLFQFAEGLRPHLPLRCEKAEKHTLKGYAKDRLVGSKFVDDCFKVTRLGKFINHNDLQSHGTPPIQ